jgi:hypothetical protein
MSENRILISRNICISSLQYERGFQVDISPVNVRDPGLTSRLAMHAVSLIVISMFGNLAYSQLNSLVVGILMRPNNPDVCRWGFVTFYMTIIVRAPDNGS